MVIDSSLMGVSLLLGQIHISQSEFDLASSALDNGLSSNFKVFHFQLFLVFLFFVGATVHIILKKLQIRENPKYHLLLAKVQRHSGDLKTAIKTLNAASNMSNSKYLMNAGNVGDSEGFSQIDKMELYMELISLYRAQGNFEDANNFMQEALSEFKVMRIQRNLCFKLNA